MKLRGKTKKGRERIKRDGADGWFLIRTVDHVLFTTEKGPWLFISKGCPRCAGTDNTSRWIHETRDPDFEIVEL